MRLHLRTLLASMLTLSPLQKVDPDIALHFRRNFIATVFDITSWTFGESFLSAATILPVFASHLTDSAIVIGMIPAILEFGMNAPPLLLAPYLERLPHKLPLVIRLGVLERIPYLLLPFAALWLNDLPENQAVVYFLILIAWMAFASGFVITPWQEMIAKVIPVSHRGRMFGTGLFLGQLLGIGGSALAAVILATFPYPQNFSVSFAVGSLGLFGSILFLIMMKESSKAIVRTTNQMQQKYLHRLHQILKDQRNFRRYLVCRWLIYFGRMPFGFIAVYAVQEFRFPDSSAAVFAGFLFASSMVGYALWGYIGDRWGNKRLLELSTGLWVIALVITLLVSITEAAWGLYLAFALMGLSNSGNLLSGLNLPLEFGPEEERPTYIALTRTVVGPALLISPLFGGWLIQTFDYLPMFGISFLFAVGSLLILNRYLQEPRTVF